MKTTSPLRPARRVGRFRAVAWLSAATMLVAATIAPAVSATPANNGTIKIHEQGTASGTESNDPKVCIFNVEGFNFDAGQTGYLFFNVQGGDAPTGTDAGPFFEGPANADGYFETEYFTLEPGHYKATLFGKFGDDQYTDEKAKSKVFKVECVEEQPSEEPSESASEEPSEQPSEEPSESPSEQASESPSEQPSESPSEEASESPSEQPSESASENPSGSELPAEGSQPPSGGVEGAVGTPAVTPPSTDTISATNVAPSSDGWRIVLVGLATILMAVLLFTQPRQARRKR
jgi:hypothetical protein